MIKSLALALLLFFHEQGPSYPLHVDCVLQGTVSTASKTADFYYWPEQCEMTYQVFGDHLWVWATEKEDELGFKFKGVEWYEFVSIPLPNEAGDYIIEYEFERSIAKVGDQWVGVQRGREYRP